MAEIKKIGFIGQGYVGKNYADDFEKRGYQVVRYSLENEYVKNKESISECDIVFVAVPTPTTPQGFNLSLLESVLNLVGKGKITVIKSTVIPGSTEKLQKIYPDIIILNSPEFLSEASASQDTSFPSQNIVGIPEETEKYKEAAEAVLSVLPKAPTSLICTSVEAEIFKYAHNVNGYFQVVMFNMIYDLAKKMGSDWGRIKQAIENDPFMISKYAEPVHKSGRGAGGNCFIKDFEAFLETYSKNIEDSLGNNVLVSLRNKNIDLLVKSKKDLDLLKGVYGQKYLQ